jgi:hypothetical protein
MTNNKFIEKRNIQMLWELISDEEIFKFLAPDIQDKIYIVFINNIQWFIQNEKNNSQSLVELNKKYIILILDFIRKNFPFQANKIVIHNESPNKELITYEEIQNERKSKFELDFTKRQEEFEELISIKSPPVPEFADKSVDKPIKEIDKILKEMQTQRNYEVEQINRTHNKSNEIENWLKPKETSLKSDKFDNKELEVENKNKFKYLNLLDNNNLSPNNLSPNNLTKKNVSFSNDIETIYASKEEVITNNVEDSIFLKLKKIKKEDNSNHIKNNSIENNYSLENRVSKLETHIYSLNEKLDKLYNLLNKN